MKLCSVPASSLYFPSGSAGDGSVVEIRVSDTGVGIATEHLDEIFQKFKQFGDLPSHLHKGTGLGLPICKEIVGHYGGKIWAESELGKGSVFIFTLPARPSAEEWEIYDAGLATPR